MLRRSATDKANDTTRSAAASTRLVAVAAEVAAEVAVVVSALSFNRRVNWHR
jgi:hypothetical protein